MWAEFTATGRASPLDLEPVEGGNIVIERWRYDGTALITVASAPKSGEQTLDLDLGEPRYVNHFATCPQAQTWRRG